MSRSRRTLLYVFAFLSFNDGFVLCQIRPDTPPNCPENNQNFKIHIQPGNIKPDLLTAAQRLLTKPQRPMLNDFNTQPFTTKPPVVTIEPPYQQVPVNVNPAPNLSIPFTPTTCNIDSVVSAPKTVTVEALEPLAPSTLDYSNAVDQNYVQFNSMSFGQISDLSAAQRLLTKAQRPILNDFHTQPFTNKPPIVTIEPPYQQVPVNVNPAPNLSIPFTPTTCNIGSVVSTPKTVTVEALEPLAPSTLDYSNAVDQNYVQFNSMSFGQISEPPFMPEVLHVDNFVQQPELTQYCQPPVTVQATSIPTVTPFYTNPVSSVFPQNVFMGARDLSPVLYSDTINSQPTPVYSQTETAPVCYGSNVVDSGSGYTVPLSLQINMPPMSEQPIIFLSPPTPAPVCQDTSYMSPLPPMVPPLIVMERSRSRWRNILPLLLIALCDSGCCKNSGSSGCSGSCNIPIPYPIPIPTNNPIILSRGNKKRKGASNSDDD